MLRKRLQFCDWQVLTRFAVVYGLTPLLSADAQYDLLVIRRHWQPGADNSPWFWAVALQRDFRQKFDIGVWFYYRDHLCTMPGSYYRAV